MVDRNPFLPFHSGRADLTAHAGQYREEWGDNPISLEGLLGMHRSESIYKSGRRHIEFPSRTYEIQMHLAQGIRKRFKEHMDDQINLEVSPTASLLSALQTMLCNFSHRSDIFSHGRYSKINSEDIVIASLGIDPALIRKRSQLYIDHTFRFIDQAIDMLRTHWDKPDSFMLEGFDYTFGSVDGYPLLGLDVLEMDRSLTVGETRATLFGMAIFDVDHYIPRLDAMRLYPQQLNRHSRFTMGYSMEVPMKRGFGLSPSFSFDDLDRLVDEGKVCFDPRGKSDADIDEHHAIFAFGRGYSDIAGLARLSLQFGTYEMLGGMVMDGIDTHRQLLFNRFYGNLPRYMSHYIRDTHAQVMGNQLVDDDEVAEQVFLGAKDNHPAISMSCSHAHINTRAASGPTPVCALRDGAGHSQSLGHVLSVVEKRLKKHEKLYSVAA